MLICGSAIFLNGCIWNPFASEPPASQPLHVVDSDGGAGGGAGISADPRPAVGGVRVDVWLVAVPRGAVSANEAFWRRVDETAFPPGKYDTLFSNGLRVGVARQEDWGYFKRVLADEPAKYSRNGISVGDEQTFEIPVRDSIDSEVLSLFETNGHHKMTTYVNCDNILKLSVAPAPRRPDAARVSLTPCVRTHEEKLSMTPEGRLQRTAPTFLYDLSLNAEVPIGQFLIISPSTDVALDSSIGRNFLLMDGGAEQMEMVLLISPVPATSPAPAVTQPAP